MAHLLLVLQPFLHIKLVEMGRREAIARLLVLRHSHVCTTALAMMARREVSQMLLGKHSGAISRIQVVLVGLLIQHHQILISLEITRTHGLFIFMRDCGVVVLPVLFNSFIPLRQRWQKRLRRMFLVLFRSNILLQIWSITVCVYRVSVRLSFRVLVEVTCDVLLLTRVKLRSGSV